jgi:hypothetical protein
MRFWLQYHSYDNLGYLPSGYETNIDDLSTLDTSNFELSCVTTAKSAIRNAINDVVFLIVGYGKSPKKYVLWSWFFIDEVEENPGVEFNAFGEGEVLNPLPLLTGKEFDEFKRQMANFSLGNINRNINQGNRSLTTRVQRIDQSCLSEIQKSQQPLPRTVSPLSYL